MLGVTGSATGQTKTRKAVKVTVVNVTVGKPTELAFKLSKFSELPAGSMTFKVKNSGRGTHNFKICTSPVVSARKNACIGRVTRMLKSGASDTLTVTLTKDGKYEFLCSVTGHAAAGMKGLLGVGVKVAAPVTKPSSSASSSGRSPVPSTGGGTPVGGGAGGGAPGECPAGTTLVQGAAAVGGDYDDDDRGGPTDFDGCL